MNARIRCMAREMKQFTRISYCLNPGCGNEVEWKRGKPAGACREACKKQVQREVARLRRSARRVEAALEHASSSAERVQLQAMRQTIGWNMQRYVGATMTPEAAFQLARK